MAAEKDSRIPIIIGILGFVMCIIGIIEITTGYLTYDNLRKQYHPYVLRLPNIMYWKETVEFGSSILFGVIHIFVGYIQLSFFIKRGSYPGKWIGSILFIIAVIYVIFLMKGLTHSYHYVEPSTSIIAGVLAYLMDTDKIRI